MIYKTRHTSAKSSDLLATRIDEVLKDIVDRGGIQDLEKAKRWLKKAKVSYKYLALCTPF